jgi:hypothetical protein
MLKARESAPYRGGAVKCALALGIALWAGPVSAQEQVACGPAETLREFLEGEGLKKTGFATLLDGDRMEVWESDTRIAITILIPDPKEPVRCLVKTLGVNRRGQGA